MVTNVLSERRYGARLSNEHELIAYTSGRMKKERIRTVVGDQVTVEVSPYDLDKGRLTFCHKEQAENIGRRPFERNFLKRK